MSCLDDFKCAFSHLSRIQRHIPPRGYVNGEQSIELSAPLHASALPPASIQLAQAGTPYVDPPSIPLPPSPRSFDIQPLSPILLFKYPQLSRKSTEEHIEQIEGDLVDARRDLAEKQNALNDLQTIVEDLRRKIVLTGGLAGTENMLSLDDAFR